MGRFRRFLQVHKKTNILLILAVLLNVLFILLSPIKPLMAFIANTTLHIRLTLASVFDLFPFSIAEVIIFLSIFMALTFIVKTVIDIIKSEKRLSLLYKRFSISIIAVLIIGFSLNLFIGSTYYGESFQDKSGVYAKPSSLEELYLTTKYFASQLSETSRSVRRDENGLFDESIDEIFALSEHVYKNSYDEFPFLKHSYNRPKKMLLSKLMSYMSYTGFYFPFTGEANINIDSPASFIPATVAHEMAHQRGIAYEHEANFVAVYTSINSGIPIYEYSGYLLAYVHLNNALYKYDRAKCYEILSLLSDEAIADLGYNNEYWEDFEGPVSEATDAVYDTFLKSYGQDLGIQSYGAVVDLLISYYCR